VSEPKPQPKPRSRKMYVLWSIALTLLIGLGLVCWIVLLRKQRDAREVRIEVVEGVRNGNRERLVAVVTEGQLRRHGLTEAEVILCFRSLMDATMDAVVEAAAEMFAPQDSPKAPSLPKKPRQSPSAEGFAGLVKEGFRVEFYENRRGKWHLAKTLPFQLGGEKQTTTSTLWKVLTRPERKSKQ
jgi:hypothetical protein